MRSLKKTILLSILSLIIIGDVIVFFAAIRDSRLALRSVTMSDMVATSKAVGNAVNIELREKLEFLRNLSFLEVMQNPESTLGDQQDELDFIADANPGKMIGLNALDKNGFCRVRGVGVLDFSGEPYHTETIKGLDNIHGPMINEVSFEHTLFLSVPIKNKANQVTGAILEALPSDFLCDIARKMRIGETGYSIIIDRTTGKTIGAPEKDDVLNEQNIPEIAKKQGYTEWSKYLDDCMAGNSGAGIFKVRGVKRVMAYSPIEGTNWTAVVMSEFNEFLAKLHSMEVKLFAVCIALIVVGLMVGIVTARALNPLKSVGDAITEIASGNADLTKRLAIKKPKQEIANVVNGFNSFASKLQEIITALKNSQEKLQQVDSKLQLSTQDSVSSITQIIANIESVNNQIVNQSASVTETAGAVNEIASNIESLERMIQKQSSGVSDASSAITQMIENINSVNRSVEKMVQSFGELEQNTNFGIQTQSGVNEMILQIEEQSKMLQEANTAIASIAGQTNLLAMNAAIEAAHAGESGKGFSVVADEIRKLSETSSQQSKTIGEELKKIQASIVNVVNESSKAATAFSSVSTSIQSTDEIVQQIKGAMEEQQIGSRQITQALTAMNDSTAEVKAASAEMAEGNKHILKQIEKLQEVTATIDSSITEMSSGAKQINETSSTLAEISGNVTNSINQIKNEIDQFKI